jgi:hypothetical protein
LTDFDESDSFCPHCDNEFVIPALTKEENKPSAVENVLSKLSHLDARSVDSRVCLRVALTRMIRDGDVNDEEMGFERDFSSRLG